MVKVGEISLFVFGSSAHRKDAIQAIAELVDDLKKNIPVWKKEVFDDGTYRWIE
jgi:molybdopterin synthase catalytic subunit